MKKTLTTAALAALLSVGTIAGASAMTVPAAPAVDTASNVETISYYGHQRILPRHVIVRMLYRNGFRDLRNIRLVRGDYVLTARGYRGTVRLVVDGRTGRILSLQPLRRDWNHHGFY